MKLSIVTTLYRSVPFMTEFHRRVSVAARALIGEDFEIIFVNDGSPDDSLQVALGLQADDPHVQVVDLSRNFGHHAAIVAGLAHSRGERVLLMDCDLEEQPEWLALFAYKMDECGADVVLSLSEILCVRHNMSARRSMYAKQDEQEKAGSGAAQHSERTH